MMLPLLVVEDDPDLREALTDTLEIAGYTVLTAQDGEAALTLLERKKVGMVISDVQMRPMDGHRLLQGIKARWPDLPVLLMTAYGVLEQAVDAMRHGACHYLTKPFAPDTLLAEVARHLRNDTPQEVLEAGVIAQSAAMQQVLQLAARVAQTDATVLLTGESGTGKEVVARYLHRQSRRANGPFVAINCAAIPEQLLESTLFGHEKGAFTGAQHSHAGKFEQAQHGTLLLDEVTEMALPLQAKLLRVLQERELERVGGTKTVTLDVRVVATSNRDLLAAVRAGVLREDLYYRLNVFPLSLPPLRERRDDLLPLARSILERLAQSGMPRAVLSPAAEQAVLAYDWPGNVRELDNVMQRASILAQDGRIEPGQMFLPLGSSASTAAVPPVAPSVWPSGPVAGEPPAGSAIPATPAQLSVPQHPAPVSDIKELEKRHILDTLAAAGGVRKLAAERLNMSERTLRYKLAQYRDEGADL